MKFMYYSWHIFYLKNQLYCRFLLFTCCMRNVANLHFKSNMLNALLYKSLRLFLPPFNLYLFMTSFSINVSVYQFSTTWDRRVRNLRSFSSQLQWLCIDVILLEYCSSTHKCRNMPDNLRKFLARASPDVRKYYLIYDSHKKIIFVLHIVQSDIYFDISLK